MSRNRILVVDDEHSIVEVLSYHLLREGFDVQTAGDGLEALQKCQLRAPDVVVLDRMLPGIDGLEVLRRLRADRRTCDIRILMLTAMASEEDEMVGFLAGADDYVVKPFRIKALVARIQSLSRRQDPTEDSQVIHHGPLRIDRVNHVATVDDKEVWLTLTEFRLLWALASHPGRWISRGELLTHCRGENAMTMERTVDVHIRSLRGKLGLAAALLETLRTVGYRLRRMEDPVFNS